MKNAIVITGNLKLDFPDLENAVRYARTSLTREGLKNTQIVWEGRNITNIQPSYGDYGETTPTHPYGVRSTEVPSFGPTTTHQTLEEAVLAAKSGDEVYSWYEGTHRIKMLVTTAE